VNVFACLVHEAPECVHDLLANLAYLDPDSAILLYDGTGGALTRQLDLRSSPEVMVVPAPKTLAWGRLHEFAIGCMRFAKQELRFDSLTIVDSDQLLLRPGYSGYLGSFLSAHPDAGCLVSQPDRQPPATLVGPARAAWHEVELWRPFLARFPDGENAFPRWTFWPSTVLTASAVDALLDLWEDGELQQLISRSRIWASEEILFPTLVALTGHRVLANPCSYDLVQYRVRFTPAQLEAAFGRPDLLWVHPVPRQISDPLRTLVRERYDRYSRRRSAVAPVSRHKRGLPRTLELIEQVKSIDGWLTPAEADLLAAATVRAVSELPGPHKLVEVGSYCGRATVVLGSVARAVNPEAAVITIDPHDGTQGERTRLVAGLPDSHARLLATLDRFGLRGTVHPMIGSSRDVESRAPVILMVVDRLHDYASVACDFAQFQAQLQLGGLVAFHDYACYFPGVQLWVDQLCATGAYAIVGAVESMVVLEKVAGLPLPQLGSYVDLGGTRPDEAAMALLAAARAVSDCGAGPIVTVGEVDSTLAAGLAAIEVGAGEPVLAVISPQVETIDDSEVVERLNDLRIGGFGLFLDATRGLGPRLAGGAVRSRAFEHALSAGRALAIRRVDAKAFDPSISRTAPPRIKTSVPAGPRRAGSSAITDPPRGGKANADPFVTCVMPTYQRRAFVPQAIGNWQAQDYPERELIIVDDGEDPVEDLVPDDDRIRYVRLNGRATIGAKRNMACEQAQGEVVIHWDDDDWSAPWRMRYQVDSLLADDADVSGLRTVYFCDMWSERAWRYEYPAARRAWVTDATFCYRRSQWERDPFPDTSFGIDTTYLWQGRPKRVAALADSSFYVGMVHRGNTSRKTVTDAWWRVHPVADIVKMMGADWDGYHAVTAAV
jgi:hypothetical protein